MRKLPLAMAAIALGGCGGSSPQAKQAASPTAAPTATVAPPPSTAPTATAPKPKSKSKPKPVPKTGPKPGPSPGSLPQTDRLPSALTPGFHAEMAALWAGIQADSVRRAMPAFFPEGAYVQIKAIGNAESDYTGRLVGDYGLDLAAAHALLGADPSAARLVTVSVPGAYAHWVPPNVCYNRVGYYEVPNARLVYRQGGALRSLGIASMISWRGVWYVVHLGAVVRSADMGVVDDPSLGPGSSTPSSTC